MNLFKYMSPDRAQMFKSMLIRFTQPGDFNDPFESIPYYHASASVKGKTLALATVFRDMDDAEWKALAVELGSAGSKEEFAEGLEKDRALVRTLYELIEDRVISVGREGMYRFVNATVGVLSLSEVSNDLLMWAHYAGCHKGFVIELDVENPLFVSPALPPMNKPQQIKYLRKRPRTTLEHLSMLQTFLVKSPHWKYEREWRYIRVLEESDEVIDMRPYPIHLFKLPEACIRSVLLGCRMDSAVKKEMIATVQSDPKLGHVRLFECGLDGEEFGILSKEIV